MKAIICTFGKLYDGVRKYLPSLDNCILNGHDEDDRARWVRVVPEYPYVRTLYGTGELMPRLGDDEELPAPLLMRWVAEKLGERAFDVDAMRHVYYWQWRTGDSHFYGPLLEAFGHADTGNKKALEKGFPEIAHAKQAWYEMGTDWLREIAIAMGWLREQRIEPNASKRSFHKTTVVLEVLADTELELDARGLEHDLLDVLDRYTDMNEELSTRRCVFTERDHTMRSQDVVRHLNEECEDRLQGGYARLLLGLNEDGTDVMDFGDGDE